MGKVFRLHEGINNLQDWQDVPKYGKTVTDAIKNPDGATMGKRITSIPSPFAVIDLVKTAFKIVTDSGDLDGDPDNPTEYHRIVSDALDVAEIFFNIDKNADKVEIVECGKETIKSIGGPVGDTLDMFMAQDAEAYNFGAINAFYILNFKCGTKPMNVIGATSPATLFFAPANDLSFATKAICFANGDFPFDDALQPLYKRDIELIRFLWILMKQRTADGRVVSDLVPEFYEYLIKTYEKLDAEGRQKLVDAKAEDIESYETISVGTATSVEIFAGVKMRKRPATEMRGTSDFEIVTSLPQAAGDKLPLVLPLESGNEYCDLFYATGKLGPAFKLDEPDTRPLNERTLPKEGTKYPYLMPSDFFEDDIIKLEWGNDSDAFFCGGAENCQYLLPIKRTVFDFFPISDVLKMVKMNIGPTGARVDVSVEIPIKCGQKIIYKKRYLENGTCGGDGSKVNPDGSIIESDFVISMMPRIRFSNPQEAIYRFGLISQEDNDLGLTLVGDGKDIEPKSVVCRNKRANELHILSYAVEGTNVDYIQVHAGRARGIVLPILTPQQPFSNKTFSFAVDLGTCNTHIEYKVDGGSSKALDILTEDRQLYLFPSKCPRSVKAIIEGEFIPTELGSPASGDKFPLRTILSVANNTDWNKKVLPFSSVNASFTYDTHPADASCTPEINIKWNNDIHSKEYIRLFIESLFIVMRNKVIMGGGEPSKTKVCWFYPISMTPGKVAKFKTEWGKAYEKYFGGPMENIAPITESIAPFYYAKAAEGAAPIATVDIGGGTTDIVIANNGKIVAVTSFRFAANNVFGNGLSDLKDEMKPLNGIVGMFMNKILNTLNCNGLNDLVNLLNSRIESRDSAEIASFLFSLRDNKEIKDNQMTETADFSKLLHLDSEVKIVLILFYFAIIYHIAHIVKTKKCEVPTLLLFSGNGSKILPIITEDESILGKLTKTIFEKVCNEQNVRDIKLKYNYNEKSPKIFTCKGGLAIPVGATVDVDELKVVLNGDNRSFVGESDTYSSISDAEGNLSKDTLNIVSTQIKEMLDLFFEIGSSKNMKFEDFFDISKESFSTAKEVCYNNIEENLNTGFMKKLEEVTPDDVQEETIFFYPLVEMLYTLSCELYNRQAESAQSIGI